MNGERRFRAFDPVADREAVRRILREVGWLTEEAANKQANDLWLGSSGGLVAELSGEQQLPAYRQAEEELMRVIAERFGLSWPMPAAVVEADTVLLATEARDLMAPPPAPWGLGVEPLPERIVPWEAERAEREYLACYEELAAGGSCVAASARRRASPQVRT